MPVHPLYPPGPRDVPAEVTKLDGAYRLRVVGMIAGLFVFLLIYIAFIVAAGLVAYWLIKLPMVETRSGKGAFMFLIFKFGGAFAALLVWLFLLKGLFKGQKVERSAYITLKEKDHPQLFGFIRQVYQEVGAPAPRRVYASAEVNAALVYDTSLLNLVVPPKKDLLIGLGLVNVVTLAEFKAVLAHEFGHFAQRGGVGLGSYLYVANRVMNDVIYSRDSLDRFVDQWAQIDIRVSFPAWALKGVLWVVRKILTGTYQSLNLLHLSLSRQLEFNADNVAVKLTGSDALIHALSRLEFANECLADAAQSLDAAADHGHFTDDLFFHQSKAAQRLRRVKKDETLGVPPALPEAAGEKVQVFKHVPDGIPDRYRSHPTDFMRERNAKRMYVRSPLDDRSPWLLFDEAEALKRDASEKFYTHNLGRREEYKPRPAEEVQKFIDAEHAEQTFNSRYHGLFDDRFLNPGDVSAVPDAWPRERVDAWLADWPPTDLKDRVAAYSDKQSEYHLLRGLKSGEYTLKGKTFTFRDREYTARDVGALFTQVDKELDGAIEGFHALDREMFLAHRSAARYLDQRDGGGREQELRDRYTFHAAVQRLLQGMLSEQNRLQAILNVLSQNQQLQEGDFNQIRDALSEIHETITVNLEDARGIKTPALTNVPAGSTLYTLIADRGDTFLPPLSGNTISGEWIGKLLTRLGGVLPRARRANFKSLGGLLAFQERVEGEWKGQPQELEQSDA